MKISAKKLNETYKRLKLEKEGKVKPKSYTKTEVESALKKIGLMIDGAGFVKIHNPKSKSIETAKGAKPPKPAPKQEIKRTTNPRSLRPKMEEMPTLNRGKDKAAKSAHLIKVASWLRNKA